MPKPAPVDASEPAAEAQLVAWGKNPLSFILDVFGPGYEDLHGEPLSPDPWQKQALDALVTWEPRHFAFAASKNALKTCTTAWIGWWILALHHNAQGYAISIDGNQLRTGLWKELAIWYALSPMLQAQFEMTATAIRARDPALRDTWFLEARSWPKPSAKAEQTVETASLKGLHGKTPFILADEAGDFPDGPIEAAEGIFAGVDARAFLVLAGNTPRQAGPLYKAVYNKQGIWWVKRISGDPKDPNRCTRVAIQWAEEQLAACNGDVDHPHYKINVRGEFPDVASDKLLGPDDLDRAMLRNPDRRTYLNEPIIVGIDTADGGADQTALCVRQGPIAFRLTTWRTGDPMVLADQIAAVLIDLKRVSRFLEGAQADAIFIDLGGQSGHGVQSRLKQLGFPAFGVNFGSPPVWSDPAAPALENRRAEMGWRCAQWVRSIGSLPEDQALRQELLEPNFWMKPTGPAKFIFEPKEAVKARLGRSPDKADGLWLTFAAPVVPKSMKEAAAAVAAARSQQKPNPFDVLAGRSRR